MLTPAQQRRTPDNALREKFQQSFGSLLPQDHGAIFIHQHAASAVRCSMSEICFMIEISDAVYFLICERTLRNITAL